MASNSKPQVVKVSGGHQSTYVVSLAGRDIGLLIRWRGQGQPWKAYQGVSMGTKFLGAHYPEQGGKTAALAQILAADQAR